MLVLATVLCLPLGWLSVQFRWIQERREARNWIASHGELDPDPFYEYESLIEPTSELPQVIKMLGETSVWGIYLDPATFNGQDEYVRERARMKRLFPEAEIRGARRS